MSIVNPARIKGFSQGELMRTKTDKSDASLIAMRYNPTFIEMKKRRLKAGEPKMLIVGAAMRKLIHIIYGVLENDRPLDSQDGI